MPGVNSVSKQRPRSGVPPRPTAIYQLKNKTSDTNSTVKAVTT